MKPDLKRLEESIGQRRAKSKLEPYRAIILRWRRDGHSFREMHAALEKNGIHVALMTLHEFVQRRTRPVATAAPAPQPERAALDATRPHVSPNNAPDPYAEQRERMRQLKQQPVVQNGKQKIYSFSDEDCFEPYTVIPDQPKET